MSLSIHNFTSPSIYTSKLKPPKMATINSISAKISPSLRLLPSNSLKPLPTICFLSPSSQSSFTNHNFLSLKQTSNSTTIFKLNNKPRSLTVVSAFKKLSESESISLSPESDAVLTSDSGVYAVYDSNGELQFIGLARNVGASVDAHRKKVPELCSSIKVGVVDEPNKETLTQAWKSWMEEHIAATGNVPPGNEKGNITWFRPLPQQKPDLRLTPGRHVQLTVPLEQLIDRLVKENKVVAFIKGSRNAPQCGFSQKVIGMLDNQGVEYESVDVLDEEYNSGLREKLKSYSNWPTFPQVFVNGELVGGCDILTSMYEKGELASLLK